MIIPYNTDAPIYHLPFATGAMIAVNVMIYISTARLDEMQFQEYVEPWILLYGTINPLQWVTSNFIHGGFFHLLGNMFGLWTFGLLVEGKVGWPRFLAIFFGLGITQCAAEQSMMFLVGEGGSLGASSIVYGLLAICLIWAPRNEMSCVVVIVYRVVNMDLTVLTLAEITIGIEVVVGVIAGLTMGSQVLHLMGVGLGLMIGIVMLKKNWVDCEGWDLFNVWTGRHLKTISERNEEVLQELNADKEAAQQAAVNELEAHWQQGLAQVGALIQSGDPSAAFLTHVRLAESLPDWQLPEREMLAMIASYHRKEMWSESVPAMVEYLKWYINRETPIRLKLAQILLHERRPEQALSVLDKLNDALMEEKPGGLCRKLRKQAVLLKKSGVLESGVQDW